MKAMKFDVTGKPELSEAIQERLFELGYKWGAHGERVAHTAQPCLSTCRFIQGIITWGNFTAIKFRGKAGIESTLSDLYDLPPDHTIVIDGNTIELSAESYKALKESLA